MSHKNASLVEESIAVKELHVGGGLLQAGRTGTTAKFTAKSNVKLGGWFNASYSYLDLDSTGAVTGLASAHCMELVLPTTTDPGGHLTVGEFELVCADSTTVNPSISMAWFQVSGDGTAKDAFNANGTLFEMTGFDDADGNIYSTGTAETQTGSIRIMIDGTAVYLMTTETPCTI